MKFFDTTYEARDWRLFIDSSKKSLKGVLLHNGNKYASIPVAHSVDFKENYEKIKCLLEKIKYRGHNWTVCGDFKVIELLLGQQPGYAKMPSFLCEWDSRARTDHWSRTEWPRRTSHTPALKKYQGTASCASKTDTTATTSH